MSDFLPENLRERLIALNLTTAEGRVKLAAAAHTPAHEEHEEALIKRDGDVDRLDVIIGALERVKRALDGSEDWALSSYGSQENFFRLLDDLQRARALIWGFGPDTSNGRIRAVRAIIEELLHPV